jgi:hypothetical protein
MKWKELSQAGKVAWVLTAFDMPTSVDAAIARRRFSIFSASPAQLIKSLAQIRDAFIVPLTDRKALILWEDK